MRKTWIARGLAMLVLGIAAIALFTLLVMSLWNALVPPLFHGPLLSFWQAAGLLVLSRILFGGLRSGGHRGPPWARGRGGHGRAAMLERWSKMTPEEREAFRAGLRSRFGGRCASGTDDASAERPA
ncbi:MAG: hypothetical protein U1F11_00490 [Steroidobacteraceae bacterium]